MPPSKKPPRKGKLKLTVKESPPLRAKHLPEPVKAAVDESVKGGK